MNLPIIFSTIITAAIIVLPAWFLYRVYKRIGRRCTVKGCGCTLKRESKILLPPDESISFRSSQGKRRWWIRRVLKLTFTVCEKHGPRLVKIDMNPMSLWHGLYIKRFKIEQFYPGDPKLTEATRQKIRELYLGGRHEKLDSQATDTPPVSLDQLFQGFFDEFSDIIGGD